MRTLKAVNHEQEDTNIAMNRKLQETLRELSERSDTFYHAEKKLADREAKIANLEA